MRENAMGVDQRLQPIKLQASLHETIWGGQNLAAVAGKRLPPGARVGESWETETGNLAVNEPYRGTTLGALVEQLGASLLGQRAIEVFGPRFPLLAKFIDAQEQLSVQVHPTDAYARAHENGQLGKTEAWYILHAAPGAQLVYGLERQVAADEVRAAIAETRLEQLLHVFAVRPGDVVFVPAGTVHAIGAGIVLYELQEYSDVTYRLYDYGRLQASGKPRELHVARGLEVMRFGAAAAKRVRPVDEPRAAAESRRRVLVGCRYFVLEEIALRGELAGATQATSCEILSVLDGECQVASDAGEGIALGLGETAVLPASLGTYRVRGAAVRLLRSYVPTEDDALLRAWRAAQPASIAD
jgi:mannose-6-phosphate isomerase